ncbi:hypothetical protein SODG_001398 [Sodalis praecaptivus]
MGLGNGGKLPGQAADLVGIFQVVGKQNDAADVVIAQDVFDASVKRHGVPRRAASAIPAPVAEIEHDFLTDFSLRVIPARTDWLLSARVNAWPSALARGVCAVTAATPVTRVGKMVFIMCSLARGKQRAVIIARRRQRSGIPTCQRNILIVPVGSARQHCDTIMPAADKTVNCHMAAERASGG